MRSTVGISLLPAQAVAEGQGGGGCQYQLVGAQETRRVLDRLVGYMVSPILSNIAGTTLSAGRVQSPAVALVVSRDREIAIFTPTNHFGVQLEFSPAQSNESFADAKIWSAVWQIVPDFASNERPYFKNEGYASEVAKIKSVTVSSCSDGQRRRSPPPPLSTSGLQQAASVLLKLEPEETMRIAQRLYEAGHITYHRTDNPNIEEIDFQHIQALAKANDWPAAEKLRLFKTSVAAQAGHPAITPTHWEVEIAGEGAKDQSLYQLIRRRAIASQLDDAIFITRVAKLTAQLDEKTLQFIGQGETLKQKGWLVLAADDGTEEIENPNGPQNEDNNCIPDLVAGNILTVSNGKVISMRTRAPKRYTKASLIGRLELEGIGRPATYASILGNIERRGYIKTRALFLSATDIAFFIVDRLTASFSFLDLRYTRSVEDKLDSIGIM